ncbi:long-chain-fatty-acid--CoA ligase [Noviherbaspirillum sedimenti]|uniref:Long-chain-fatty-acid--CoA ligase n=1 Tax=Noviherbaspirillum sedimenti TaxID=2320865 RepID=A0A3A3GP00_9BURK|nr:long-chain-fatty-acid--CoA ligase [Noviherbaspirillum sedimenti]RJG02690.1 long-chain-fatty-acid--CoA ligase [Noviherbaspirillum sedimenti]
MDYRAAFNRGITLYPERDVLVDGDRRFTWKQWGERQHRLGNALLGLGLKKGDRVGVVLKNCAECFDAFAAGAKTGIVVVPINYRLNPDAICTIIADAECRALLVHTEFAATVQEMSARLPALEAVIAVGGAVDGLLDYESLLASASSAEPQAVHADDDLAVVIYTTGTTGDPKGAMATRRSMIMRMCCIAIEMQFGPEDRYLNSLPIFHVAGIIALGALFRCATNIILKDFIPLEFCRTVQQEKVTKAFLAPAVLNVVLNFDKVNEYDLSSLSRLLYGASPMPQEVLRRTIKVLPHCDMIQAFGASECFTIVFLSPGDHREALTGAGRVAGRLNSAGRQASLSEVRVVRDDGTNVIPGEVGEVIARSGQVMAGYLNKPKETAEAIRDGWYYTRDLATVDEDGYIYIVDRKSHMIITGGENVYPAQIENALFDHPKIANVAVIGVPDSKWGEVVKAFIVCKPGEKLTEREVIEFCAPRMASYAKPKSVEFLDSLPVTATGKLNKLELKKKYWAGSAKMIG